MIDILTDVRNLLVADGIFNVKIGPISPKDPDDIVVLNTYPLEDNMLVGLSLTGLQVRIRGNTTAGYRPVYEMQERILQLLSPTPLPDTAVVVAWRQSSAPLGLDPQGRPEIADNYYLRSDRLGRSG